MSTDASYNTGDAVLIAFLRNNAVALADALEAARRALEAIAAWESNDGGRGHEGPRVIARAALARLAVPEEPTDE